MTLYSLSFELEKPNSLATKSGRKKSISLIGGILQHIPSPNTDKSSSPEEGQEAFTTMFANEDM